VSYLGYQRYFLTMCTNNRHRWFVDATIVALARSLLLTTARHQMFAVCAYCFMPNHLHVLAEGESERADLRRFVSLFKQQAGFRFSQQHEAVLWQDGYHDRLLRDDEQTLEVARYILENPVRAGLVSSYEQYPFSGSGRYSVRELAEAVAFRPRRSSQG
jgi:putative transposase